MSTAEREFTITVSDRDRIQVEHEGGFHLDENDVVVTFRADMDRLRLDTIAVLEQMLRTRRIKRREELQVLGRHLYRVLFDDRLAALFERKLREVPPGGRLRLQLNFADTAAELAKLPWEYLYYEPGQSWFSTAVEFVLSRYLKPLRSERREA